MCPSRFWHFSLLWKSCENNPGIQVDLKLAATAPLRQLPKHVSNSWINHTPNSLSPFTFTKVTLLFPWYLFSILSPSQGEMPLFCTVHTVQARYIHPSCYQPQWPYPAPCQNYSLGPLFCFWSWNWRHLSYFSGSDAIFSSIWHKIPRDYRKRGYSTSFAPEVNRIVGISSPNITLRPIISLCALSICNLRWIWHARLHTCEGDLVWLHVWPSVHMFQPTSKL